MARENVVNSLSADDDDGMWTELRPFTYYARYRTAEQRCRLWAMVGGRTDEWTDEDD